MNEWMDGWLARSFVRSVVGSLDRSSSNGRTAVVQLTGFGS